MKSITIQKECERCERSSTYILKHYGKDASYYVCSNCKRKLCRQSDIMNVAFPREEKPVSGIGREHLRKKKK